LEKGQTTRPRPQLCLFHFQAFLTQWLFHYCWQDNGELFKGSLQGVTIWTFDFASPKYHVHFPLPR